MKATIEKIRTPDAPVEMSATVFVTNGEQAGKVTITFAVGVIPSTESIIKKIKKLASDELNGMLDGSFRLMTSEEFFQAIIYEKTGSNEDFAVPNAYRKFNYEI